MGRCKTKKYEKCYFQCEVFFLTDDQQLILETALDTVEVPYGEFSKAIRRSIALMVICNDFLNQMDIKHPLKIIKSSAITKQKARK